jgi:hypothetical protein
MVIRKKRRGKATFEGKNNSSKGIVFMLLYLLNERLTVKEMEMYLATKKEELSFKYIESRVKIWWEWGCLSRQHRKCDHNTPPFEYSLIGRGRSLLRTFQDMKPKKFRSLQIEVEGCIGRIREAEHLRQWASLVARKSRQRMIADNLKGLGRPEGEQAGADAGNFDTNMGE